VRPDRLDNLEARSWQKWFFSVPSGWQATLTFDDYSPYGPAGSRLAGIFAYCKFKKGQPDLSLRQVFRTRNAQPAPSQAFPTW